MKVNIEFELPTDQYEFDNCIAGSKYRMVLNELDTMLRNQIKYNTEYSDEAIKVYEDCRTFLHNVLEGYNLRINE